MAAVSGRNRVEAFLTVSVFYTYITYTISYPAAVPSRTSNLTVGFIEVKQGVTSIRIKLP